ncbi:MAG: hypothetical protein ACQEXJ_09815 [Myxococcota bacterium]
MMPFVRRSGLHKARVYNALRGSRSLAVVAEVVRLHPDVDARWLLTGEPAGPGLGEPGLDYDTGDDLRHRALRRVASLLDEHGDLVAMRLLGYLDGIEPELEREGRTGDDEG